MKNNAGNNYGKYKLIIVSALIELAVTAVFVIIFGAVMYFTEMSNSYAAVLATASVSAGCFTSAFYAAKTVRAKGFIVGLIVGAVTFTVVMLISFITDKGAVSLNTLFHLIIFMLSSLIGGIMGVNKAANKKYI